MIQHGLVVPEALNSQLLDFALITGIKYFRANPAGPNRRLCNLNLHDLKLSQQVRVFAEQCFNKVFGVQVISEPNFGNFLGVNETGAFVQEHQDSVGPEGECHTRLNFLIQKPDNGGMPIINNSVLIVKEGQCWINLASSWKHSSTPVVGNKPRVILSLGSYVPQSIASIAVSNSK